MLYDITAPQTLLLNFAANFPGRPNIVLLGLAGHPIKVLSDVLCWPHLDRKALDDSAQC